MFDQKKLLGQTDNGLSGKKTRLKVAAIILLQSLSSISLNIHESIHTENINAHVFPNHISHPYNTVFIDSRIRIYQFVCIHKIQQNL